MQHFQCLASGVDVAPLLLAIKRQPDLWAQETVRQDTPGTRHSDTESILLRWQHQSLDELDCTFCKAWWMLPQARPLLAFLMQRTEAIRLGRMMIAKLKPGGHISAHKDSENCKTYVPFYKRVHLALESLPGNRFRCGEEEVWMRAGEVWWFDNAEVHEVWNESAGDRLHLILDFQPMP